MRTRSSRALLFGLITVAHFVLTITTWGFWWDRGWRGVGTTFADRLAEFISTILMFPLANRVEPSWIGLFLNSIFWGAVLTLGVIETRRRIRHGNVAA